MAATTHGASPTRKEPPHVEMTLKGHEGAVNGVAFIRGTRLLVTCSDDKSLRVWDLDTGKQVGEPLLGHDERVLCVAASSDGCWIVSGEDYGRILVWEVETKKRVPVSFKGHSKLNAVFGVVFAPDNETFASASDDKTVCVWKRKTGEIILGPFRVGSLAYSVAYSPDGTKLAAGTQEHIIIWNSANGEELLKIEQRAWRVAFTRDGLRLVSGSYKDIRMSDAATGDIIKHFDAHTQAGAFLSLAIAPNSSKFATTSSDKTTQFFDLNTFEPIGEPLEHPAIVHCLAFSEDSQLIATGCYNNLVRTWTVPRSESEKESQQAAQKILEKTIQGPKPRPQRTGIPPRFFDDVDTRSPPTRYAEGSQIKNMMIRLFSRSSAPQGDTPLPSKIPAVDVFPTRGKYRNATAIDAKRHVVQRPRPPLQQAHIPNTGVANAGASGSSAPPVGTSNVTNGTTPATLQTGSTSASAATNRPPSPMDVEYIPDISCFVLLARCFPCFSRTRQTSTTASHTR